MCWLCFTPTLTSNFVHPSLLMSWLNKTRSHSQSSALIGLFFQVFLLVISLIAIYYIIKLGKLNSYSLLFDLFFNSIWRFRTLVMALNNWFQQLVNIHSLVQRLSWMIIQQFRSKMWSARPVLPTSVDFLDRKYRYRSILPKFLEDRLIPIPY